MTCEIYLMHLSHLFIHSTSLIARSLLITFIYALGIEGEPNMTASPSNCETKIQKKEIGNCKII